MRRTMCLLLLCGCPLEEDTYQEVCGGIYPAGIIFDSCRPGDIRCAGDDTIQTCSDEACWGERQTFVCVVGSCQVMDGTAVCM